AAHSRPLKLGKQRAILGVQLGEPKKGEGVAITSVTDGSAASKAGVKVDDIIVKFDGKPVADQSRFSELMGERAPGDNVTLTVRRGEKTVELKAKLDGAGQGGRGRGWDSRQMQRWKEPVYRLAVVCIEYPDVKHN